MTTVMVVVASTKMFGSPAIVVTTTRATSMTIAVDSIEEYRRFLWNILLKVAFAMDKKKHGTICAMIHSSPTRA